MFLHCCLFIITLSANRHNHFTSGVTGGVAGGQSGPPETSDREIFADDREKRGKEKNGKGVKIENWEEKKESCKRGGGKLEMEVGKVIKRGEDPFLLFFFFVLFCFFLLFTFENNVNLFWVYQNGNFLLGKSISCQENNQEKWLCPLRKICLLCPCISRYLGWFATGQLHALSTLIDCNILHNSLVIISY